MPDIFGGLVYFLKQSAGLFFERIGQQLTLRKERFDKAKTPKRVFSFWFFVFLLGQIGIITSLIWGSINGEGFVDALAKQGKSGNFLTFEISLILSCLVYYFEEYGEEPIKELFFLRVTLLIGSMLVAFLAMINYIYINSAESPKFWSMWFVFYNAALYFAGAFLSYAMYITFSVVEKTASEDAKDKTEAALSAASGMLSTNSATIGDKKISL
ncbi:hypothetical protein [Uliginosibacterium sp. 31-12]|uniref:hypothetical protein n=1 Tax=Uliginosibacterium sp. 31-12 TaxID=3062781 RepID=UPI0026E2A0A6|nr:hypothetical protein [Uliginosibacterium sp. 31-12]MDO6387903.1 hypothetical protein [Uliginosibacterium sp. 31-12]